MKHTILIGLTIWGLMYLTSCHQTGYYVIKKYNNGNERSKIHYLKDSIKEGLATQYREDGSEEFEFNYKNNKLDGWLNHYTRLGNIDSSKHYTNGKLNGRSYWYYPNGKYMNIANFLNNYQYGGSYYYYPNGILNTYNSVDFKGDCFYVLKYSNNGILTKEEGLAFSSSFLSNLDTGEIIPRKEIIISMTVAQPPGRKTFIKIGDLDKDNQVTNLKTYNIDNNTVTFKRIYSSPGIYRFVTLGVISDSASGNIIHKDSVVTRIPVHPGNVSN